MGQFMTEKITTIPNIRKKKEKKKLSTAGKYRVPWFKSLQDNIYIYIHFFGSILDNIFKIFVLQAFFI